MTEQDQSLLELTADVVSAYVSNNPVRLTELSELIPAVHSSLSNIGKPQEETTSAAALTPAVSIKKSVTEDYIICLEDGKKFKSLKRHLQTAYGLTLEQYRAKWGLPHNYPVTAPSYAAQRSALAKAFGLGNNRRFAEPVVTAPEPAPAPAPANDAVGVEPAKKRAATKRAKPIVEVGDEPVVTAPEPAPAPAPANDAVGVEPAKKRVAAKRAKPVVEVAHEPVVTAPEPAPAPANEAVGVEPAKKRAAARRAKAKVEIAAEPVAETPVKRRARAKKAA